MKKRNVLRMICLAAALVVLSGAVCYAYFTDYEEAKGGAVVQLNGKTEIHEDADKDGKVLEIENTDETDVIVRVGIYGDFMTVDADKADWTKGEDGFWYYNKILPAGGKTGKINVTIDKEKAGDMEDDFDIVVVHESARVLYEGTEPNKVIRPDGWELPDIEVSNEEVSD
jgi:predicted ribosomally synthesized peptide with SipW-like signal peptide